MFIRILPLILLCLLLSDAAFAQFKEVIPAQVDPRFSVRYQYETTSRGLNEEIRFSIQNNTNRELVLTIKATARYHCNISQSFTLGMNGVVHLPPNGRFTSAQDYVHSITQKSKDCYREAGNGNYTSFIQADYWLLKVVDLTAEKEAKAKADEQKKADAAKAAQEREAKATADKKAAQEREALQKQKSATEQKQTTATKNTAQDDFWESGKKAETASTQQPAAGVDRSKLPELFQTTNGKYYQKDANNNVRQISYDEFMQIKHNRSQEKQNAAKAQQAEESKAKQAAGQKAVDDAITKMKKDQEAQNQIYKDIDQKFDQYAQQAANNRAVADSRENLQEASTLSGNYQSVDQLMAEFNQKMRQVNSSVEQLRVNKDAAWSTAMNNSFSGNEAVYGETLKAIGGIVNAAKAEKQRKEAQAELRLQKQLALNRMEAEEKRLLTGIRTDLFARFKEGALPLSSSKLKASTIYYFVYAYDPAQTGTKQPLLYVSNVFAVNRYSDGTWPFKTTFTSDIQKLTPYSEVMHGYYTKDSEAESMRQGMLDIFQQSGGTIKTITYKNKKVISGSSGSNASDFWETGNKRASPENKAVKKDDFWEN